MTRISCFVLNHPYLSQKFSNNSQQHTLSIFSQNYVENDLKPVSSWPTIACTPSTSHQPPTELTVRHSHSKWTPFPHLFHICKSRLPFRPTLCPAWEASWLQLLLCSLVLDVTTRVSVSGLSSVDWSLLTRLLSLSVRWHWLVLALPRYLEFHMLHKESEYFSKIIYPSRDPSQQQKHVGWYLAKFICARWKNNERGGLLDIRLQFTQPQPLRGPLSLIMLSKCVALELCEFYYYVGRFIKLSTYYLFKLYLETEKHLQNCIEKKMNHPKGTKGVEWWDQSNKVSYSILCLQCLKWDK